MRLKRHVSIRGGFRRTGLVVRASHESGHEPSHVKHVRRGVVAQLQLEKRLLMLPDESAGSVSVTRPAAGPKKVVRMVGYQ
ncbi:hypothetical protein [Nonomuraea glycinis]|uniref:hypothetical protein n=1 Tax=Nonomuraea glycinis TaxID=2047744 RepID=UPI002E10829A|nr:hypothetical protein OHA68_00910 [Nonomuraea glycinis]